MQDTIDALQEVRELASQFAAERLRPNVESWDHERRIGDDVLAELAGLGFHGMLVPESYGGLGFGLPTFTAVLDEIAWGEPAVAFHLLASGVVATALRDAVGGPRGRDLEALAAGETAGRIALAPNSARLRAQRDGDGWSLVGTARWVLSPGGSGISVLEATTTGAETSFFAVPHSAQALFARGREDTLGLRAARIGTIELRSVRLDPDARLGTPSEMAGIRVVEWLGTAAIAAGIGRAALEHAVEYADVREQFDQKLRMFQGIRAKLADMAVQLHAARSALREAATRAEPVGAASARVFASEAAMWITTQAVQIFGGYGYMRDYPVEKTMRDARATGILTGTNDALREVIAAGLYGD